MNQSSNLTTAATTTTKDKCSHHFHCLLYGLFRNIHKLDDYYTFFFSFLHCLAISSYYSILKTIGYI